MVTLVRANEAIGPYLEQDGRALSLETLIGSEELVAGGVRIEAPGLTTGELGLDGPRFIASPSAPAGAGNNVGPGNRKRGRPSQNRTAWFDHRGIDHK